MAEPSEDYGKSVADSAQAFGRSVYNSFDPKSTAQKQQDTFQGLYNSQTGTIGDYISKYANTIRNNPNVTDLYKTANEQYGVPGLMSNANYLNTQVTNQMPMQYQKARGFDVSDAQVQNATNTALRFLQPQATAATNAAQTAQQLAGQQVSAGLEQNRQNLLPVQAEGSLVNDAMARQSSGYTTAAENELQGLISKLNSGVALTQAEMERANVLAQMQTSYQNAKTAAEAQIQAANIAAAASRDVAQIGNQYQNVKAGDNLVNTFTNSIINPSRLTAGNGTYRG